MLSFLQVIYLADLKQLTPVQQPFNVTFQHKGYGKKEEKVPELEQSDDSALEAYVELLLKSSKLLTPKPHERSSPASE